MQNNKPPLVVGRYVVTSHIGRPNVPPALGAQNRQLLKFSWGEIAHGTIFVGFLYVVNLFSTGQHVNTLNFLDLVCERNLIAYPTPSPHPVVHTPGLLGLMRDGHGVR